MLRNRISALENRVEKKKKLMHYSSFPQQFKTSFNKMVEILLDEVSCSCRDNIMNRLAATKSSKQPSHTALAKSSPNEFKKRLTE